MTLHYEDRADHRWIGTVRLLPGLVTQDDDRRRRKPAVISREQAAAERAHTKRGEIRSGDVFRAPRVGSLCCSLPPDAQRIREAERRYVLAFPCPTLQSLVQRE